MAAKIKAYAVQEQDEQTGGIVFARGPAHARLLGSSIFGSGEKDWGEATRAPWADEFRHTDVPASAMFEAGWYFECSGCGQRIAEGEEDDDGHEIPFNIIGNQHCAYCTPECANKSHLRKLAVQQLEAEVLAHYSELLLANYPGVWLWGKSHVYVPHGKQSAQQVRISFRFPGCSIGDAHWGFDKESDGPTVTVCNGDLAAWESWREKVRSTSAASSHG